MTRIQKKCLVASSGFHGLLLVVLIFSSAFIGSRPQRFEDGPVLTLMPNTTDATTTGGTPLEHLPPPAQPSPPPVTEVTKPAVTKPVAAVTPPSLPKPPAAVKPALVKPTPAPREQAPTVPRNSPKTDTLVSKPTSTKLNPESLAPKTDKKPAKPEINTTPITRRAVPRANTEGPSKAEQEAEARANARALANQLARASSTVKSGMSTSTEIEPIGNGDEGPAVANYGALISSTYKSAWNRPQDVTGDINPAVAAITVAKDGSVISAQLIEPSGNARVDRALRDVLEQVKFIAPFPPASKDAQRTYKLKFNLNSSLSLG